MAFGNASAERAALEATYEDTATISRTDPTRGKNNISTSVPGVVYDEIICALSLSGSDKSNQTKAQNTIDYDAIIFFPPDLTVLPGDSITVKRFGRDNANSTVLLNYEAVGRSSLYPTHQEVKVKDGDLA